MNKQLPVNPTKGEYIFGFIYLPLYIFLLGTVLTIAMELCGLVPDDISLNAIYYVLNFVVVSFAMRKYLTASLTYFGKNAIHVIMYVALGFLAYLALNTIVSIGLTAAFGDLDNPNNNYVSELYTNGKGVIIAGAVLLAPPVEEALFRGVVFGAFRKKSRLLAYVMSCILFSMVHVIAYVFESPDWMLLVNALQYVAPTVVFCWVYERTGCIYCPMILHSLINLISISLLYGF